MTDYIAAEIELDNEIDAQAEQALAAQRASTGMAYTVTDGGIVYTLKQQDPLEIPMTEAVAEMERISRWLHDGLHDIEPTDDAKKPHDIHCPRCYSTKLKRGTGNLWCSSCGYYPIEG